MDRRDGSGAGVVNVFTINLNLFFFWSGGRGGEGVVE